MTPCILIGVPCKGQIAANHYKSILLTLQELQRENIKWGLSLSEHGTVDAARNEIVQSFLEDKQFTHLFFWDADVGAPHDAIPKLVSYKVPVVCGVYPCRKLPLEYKASILDTPTQPKSNLLVAIGVPAGFMLIERWVIERLVTDYAHREYQHLKEKRIALFEHELSGGHYYSEDVNFCRRCVAAGILIHVDPTIEFTHQGDYLFKGKLNDILKPNGPALSPTLRP